MLTAPPPGALVRLLPLPDCEADVRVFDTERAAALAAAEAGDDDAVIIRGASAIAQYRGGLLPGVYDDWAASLGKQGNRQGAVDKYDEGLKRLDGDKDLANNAIATWDNWAKSYFPTKEWPKAIEVYRRALERFPDNSVLRNNLEYCEAKMKE